MIRDWNPQVLIRSRPYCEVALVEVYLIRGRETYDELRASAEIPTSISARTELFRRHELEEDNVA